MQRIKLLAPFFITMGALFVAPMTLIVAYSFMKAGAYGGVEPSFSFDAYVQILFEKDFDGVRVFNPAALEVFWRSLKLAGLCTILCAAIGFPVAYYMSTRAPAKRNIWILLVTIPFWTNLLVRTYAWMLFLRDDGVINNVLKSIGLPALPLLYNDFAVTLGLVYSYLPFMILPLYASLERLDWKLVEAAQDLYADKKQTLLRVVLPLSLPGLIGGATLVFIPALGSFLASDLLGGGKHMMIGNMIQQQFGFSRDWPFGAALSVVLMIAALACMRRAK